MAPTYRAIKLLTLIAMLALPMTGAASAQLADASRSPDQITPIPLVQEIIDQISIDRMMTYARELSGEQPTTVAGAPVTLLTRYSYNNDAVILGAGYMAERLERLGLSVSYHWWTHSPQITQPTPNVVAEKPGTNPAAGIYIIGAHLDDTSGSAPNLAPGADDNGSGSVAVLTAAELLAPYNFEATIRFVLFTGEEQGLWGSQAYASSVAAEDLRGMLNMDMIAWDSQGGPDMDLHANSGVAGSVSMGQLYADVVDAYSFNLTPVVYSNGTTASDHASFWNIGVPAVLAIENYRADGPVPGDFNAYYHSINDRTQHYNLPFFQEMTGASLATLAHLAGIRSDCYWADLNCDEAVTALDLAAVTGRWISVAGQWSYTAAYDTDDDGDIDIADVQSVASQWGWTSPG